MVKNEGTQKGYNLNLEPLEDISSTQNKGERKIPGSARHNERGAKLNHHSVRDPQSKHLPHGQPLTRIPTQPRVMRGWRHVGASYVS